MSTPYCQYCSGRFDIWSRLGQATMHRQTGIHVNGSGSCPPAYPAPYYSGTFPTDHWLGPAAGPQISAYCSLHHPAEISAPVYQLHPPLNPAVGAHINVNHPYLHAVEPIILTHEELPELFEDPFESNVPAEAANYHGNSRQQWRPYGPAQPNRPPRRDLHSYESSSASFVSDLFDHLPPDIPGRSAEAIFVLRTGFVRGNPEDTTTWVTLEAFYPQAGPPPVADQHHCHEDRDSRGSPQGNADSRSERNFYVSPRRGSNAEGSDTPSDEELYEPTADDGLESVNRPRNRVTVNHDEQFTEAAPQPQE